MGWLVDLMKGVPTVAVAHERIALAEEKVSRIEAENKRLADENAALKAEVEQLRRQVPSLEFVSSRGVLFKRKADGSIEPDAYCPDCKKPMWALERMFPPKCSACGFKAPFQKGDIPSIIADLAR